MPKTEPQLKYRVKEILEDLSNAMFSEPAISSQLQDCVKEASEIIPLEARHIIQVPDSTKLGDTLKGNIGRELDISSIDNLISIQAVESPIDEFPRKFRLFKPFFNTVTMEIDTRLAAGDQNDLAGNAQVLTGTVTFTAASNAITGSGTAFTSELKVGYSIAKSGSSNWYRVSTITDDTNIIVSINVATADDGADTVTKTKYWHEEAQVYCNENHYLEATVTDFAGAIDAGVAIGYAEDVYKITIDTLTAGTMPKGTFLTIAGVEGTYRTTSATIIASTEGDFYIEPRLKGRAAEDAVVTFLGSTLTPQMEGPICDLTAGRVVFNWENIVRTAANNAITAYGLANAALDSMTLRITTAVTDIGTVQTAAAANFAAATTALGDANTYLDNADAAIDKMSGDIELAAGLGADGANLLAATTGIISLAKAEVDKAIANVSDNNALLDGNLTEIVAQVKAIKDQLALGIDDVARARTLSDLVPVWGDPASDNLRSASSEMGNANAKFNEMIANIEEGRLYSAEIPQNLNTARGFLNETSARMAVEAQLTQESLQEARERIRNAYGSISQANGYIQADAQKTASLYRLIGSEFQAANTYFTQSTGYFREADASLKVVSSFRSMREWAILKIRDAKEQLRLIQPSVKVSVDTTRS